MKKYLPWKGFTKIGDSEQLVSRNFYFILNVCLNYLKIKIIYQNYKLSVVRILIEIQKA